MPTPCFVVPGFIATELDTQALGLANFKIWPNDAYLFANGAGAMQLAPDGINPGPLATFRLAPNGAAFPSTISPLVSALTYGGYATSTYFFDWRQTIVSAAKGLAAFISALVPSSIWKIVCHSMGGLVFRLAFQQLSPVIQGNCKAVVYLSTPFGGSLAAAQALAGKILFNNWANYICAAVKFQSSLTVPLVRFQGSPQQNLNATLASFPGLAELLPSFTPTWQSVDPLAALLLAAGSYNATNIAVTQGFLDSAEATQNLLEASLTGPQPAVQVCAVGTGHVTPDTVADITKLGAPAGYNNTTAGDGVVAVDRGVLPGATSVQTLTGTSHAGMLAGSDVLNYINSWLATTPPTQTLPQVIEPKMAGPQPTLPDPAVNLFIPAWKQTVNDP